MPIIVLITIFSSLLKASPLHLDLEMNSEEYRELLQSSDQKSFQETPSIEYALKLGDRLSKWISLLNAHRSPDRAIRLTSATTRTGIPIDKPNVYSPSLIQEKTEQILKELPQEMKTVLISALPLPSSISLDDETFITHARKLDKNYQQAARYKSINSFRLYYIEAANKDVRGYHYLVTNKFGENELRDVSLIPEEKVGPLKKALTLICVNTKRDFNRCQAESERAYSSNKLSEFYAKYIQRARENWNSFFLIPPSAIRSDVHWTDTVTMVPFNTPKIPKFVPYLQNNIEDEFRWKNWALKLNFGYFPNGPLLKFEAGVVPHVNRLGGNEIVMDSNQPIEEYESQWTIRHEFGHVLGLPDCYHEFYDVNLGAYVNYQLDTTDLMCSRAGNMNERIFLELKKAYR